GLGAAPLTSRKALSSLRVRGVYRPWGGGERLSASVSQSYGGHSAKSLYHITPFSTPAALALVGTG
ncbi:hypothetical protein DSO57_1036643, partial [Entomophthora muscae]